MTDKPEIVGYAFPGGKGLLLANDVTEPEKHRELALIRLTDHETAMDQMHANYNEACEDAMCVARKVRELETSRAADKARIADLTEQRDSFQRVGIEAITARSDAIELLRAIHNGIHCDTLPGNLYQRLELMLFPAQQGKEGVV